MTKLLTALIGGLGLGLYLWHGADIADAYGTDQYVLTGFAFFWVWVVALVSAD